MSKTFEYSELVEFKRKLITPELDQKIKRIFEEDDNVLDVAIEAYTIGVLSFLGLAYKELNNQSEVDIDGEPHSEDRDDRKLLEDAMSHGVVEFIERPIEEDEEIRKATRG